MKSSEKVVGQTASTGFQIGVRRKLPISAYAAWQFLTSVEGLQLWIGRVSSLHVEVGESFTSQEGVTGEFRVVKPLQQLRLKWKRNDWDKPSTLQIRLLSDQPERTTISFHQENLSDALIREQMKQHWESVIDTIGIQTKIS